MVLPPPQKKGKENMMAAEVTSSPQTLRKGKKERRVKGLWKKNARDVSYVPSRVFLRDDCSGGWDKEFSFLRASSIPSFLNFFLRKPKEWKEELLFGSQPSYLLSGSSFPFLISKRRT